MSSISPSSRTPTAAVLISGGVLAPGGVQTHLEYLCKLLIEHKVSLTIAASGCQWKSAEVDALSALGCRFLMPPRILLRSRKLALLWSVISWTFRLWGKSFTSAYYIGGGRSHFFLKRLLGKRTPSIYHEIVESPVLGSDEDRLAAGSTAIVANSRKIASEMVSTYPSAHIRVIPFLTTSSVMPITSSETEPPGSQGVLRFVYLGRLVSHKRPDKLVYQWKEISVMDLVGPATLDVYGYDLSGEMIGSLCDYVHTHNLEDQITIHGAYNFASVSNCLENKHILVLPSLFEGLPLVLVEAMTRGIPIVACNSGGTAELAEGNPDVVVTSTEWDDFIGGLCEMAKRVRTGSINPQRLKSWTSSRYGYEFVAQKWLEAVLTPETFFSL